MKKILMFFVLLAFAGSTLGMNSGNLSFHSNDYDPDVYLSKFADLYWEKLKSATFIKDQNAREMTAVLATMIAFLSVIHDFSMTETDAAEESKDKAIAKESGENIYNAYAKSVRLLFVCFNPGDAYDSIKHAADLFSEYINAGEISQYIQDVVRKDRTKLQRGQKWEDFPNEYFWNRAYHVVEFEILQIVLDNFEIVIREMYKKALDYLPMNLTKHAFNEPGKIERCFSEVYLSDVDDAGLREFLYCKHWIKKLKNDS